MPEKLKRRWWYGNTIDENALEAIKARYGFTDDSTALRFVLRLVASPNALQVKIPSKDSKVVKSVKKSLNLSD